ncbi:unnamed protein product, partial [Pleuronectes platessa]
MKSGKLRSDRTSLQSETLQEPRADIDGNPMSLLDGLQDCENVTACIIQRKQDFETFLDSFEEQKIQDRLLSASEISHSYSQKLLVMTDKDKSTEDRVQQEYSLDPHYSVIVSKDCLYNESCCPEADGYTVVQIFGSLSEDGQSVSGLSGSSLAELMFKPSLTGTPVFSLSGSTSTHFQQNFMRFFQIRGIKAVLETNQENHQLYQVMDQPDCVSSYTIPQRPVDHTTQYDHQQIIIMESDPVVRKAATFLYQKHPEVSSVYILDENQRPKLIHGASVPLSEDSRLVLVGHGAKDDSGEMRLSGYGAQDVAKVIQRTSRVSDTIKTTSVVACEVGSDKDFIQTLLTELRKSSIETELHLRNAVIQVQHTGQKITQEISPDGVKWSHKDDSKKVVANLDRNGDAIIRKEPGSKGEAVFTDERNFLMDKSQSKASASLAEEIHSRLKEKYGETLAGLHLKEGSDRIEKGQFICELLSKDTDAKPVEFRFELSPESLRHNENVFKGLDTAAQDMEGFKPQHPTNKYAEHTGTAVGSLGLLLGMSGAVNAFEQGDIKDGAVAALQTAHGVTVDKSEDEKVMELMLTYYYQLYGEPGDDIFFLGPQRSYVEGAGGNDTYIIPINGGKTIINNYDPSKALDTLHFTANYSHISVSKSGNDVVLMYQSDHTVTIQNWFSGELYRHMNMMSGDGVLFEISSTVVSSVRLVARGINKMFQKHGEYVNALQPLLQTVTNIYGSQFDDVLIGNAEKNLLDGGGGGDQLAGGEGGDIYLVKAHKDDCAHTSTSCIKSFSIDYSRSTYPLRVNLEESEAYDNVTEVRKVMDMAEVHSVKDMLGSAGFDIMVGNRKDNLLDPSTGGALMSGGEGEDTYIIKQGYGDNLVIDNFANDQKIDTVLIDMDFVAGGQVTLDSSSTGDVNVTITTKGEQLKFTLMGYNDSNQTQHLEFQSSDGVVFRLKSLNSTAEVPLFQTEAFKVTLPPSQSDCRFDLGSWKNLSKVHTVQGCPSQSNDILGNDEDNALIGGWKDDTLAGGQGDDTLIGGNGSDILIGGLGDDTLYGEDGNDTMMGNSGSDVFIPGPGADLIDGGPGRDTVLYRGDHVKGQGVYVNLLTGQGRYADAEGDVLKDVETVIGTIYSDILVSGYESSLLKGSDGNDILVSTGGDYLVGGDGSDIYMLAFQSGSVSIDNCAKDNATDVLFLGSGPPLA